ncbi:hypothetical protein BJ085DRAFT_32652 [Dimargaris cristalligena]|uniref:C2H2-type domain-containing protein n=1 Tax=Dimargaris cristalligena TaxID=215637 RepID=A0A4V1J490_9FUNG|nr:hypothetical protein BJ085DRAFT_32652 [Dimargaris cristalligena]|eukprot:RKP34729.1 hypothetical protein BJ085DRAFT_32652 [Dimargaris cristalligena]
MVNQQQQKQPVDDYSSAKLAAGQQEFHHHHIIPSHGIPGLLGTDNDGGDCTFLGHQPNVGDTTTEGGWDLTGEINDYICNYLANHPSLSTPQASTNAGGPPIPSSSSSTAFSLPPFSSRLPEASDSSPYTMSASPATSDNLTNHSHLDASVASDSLTEVSTSEDPEAGMEWIDHYVTSYFANPFFRESLCMETEQLSSDMGTVGVTTAAAYSGLDKSLDMPPSFLAKKKEEKGVGILGHSNDPLRLKIPSVRFRIARPLGAAASFPNRSIAPKPHIRRPDAPISTIARTFTTTTFFTDPLAQYPAPNAHLHPSWSGQLRTGLMPNDNSNSNGSGSGSGSSGTTSQDDPGRSSSAHHSRSKPATPKPKRPCTKKPRPTPSSPNSLSKSAKFLSPSDDHPTKCKICQQTFSRPEHLERHRKIHQDVKDKVLCTRCGAQFARGDSLVRHSRDFRQACARRVLESQIGDHISFKEYRKWGNGAPFPLPSPLPPSTTTTTTTDPSS